MIKKGGKLADHMSETMTEVDVRVGELYGMRPAILLSQVYHVIEC